MIQGGKLTTLELQKISYSYSIYLYYTNPFLADDV